MAARRPWSTGGLASQVLPLAFLLIPGCGAGVAALASGFGGSNGDSMPALSAFLVPDPKVSPAPLRLEANVSLAVELSYSIAGSDEQPMSLLAGNPARLDPGANDLAWDFESDLGTTRLTRDVTLRARQGGALVQGGELALFGMGNDPPVVVSVEPVLNTGEAAGNVEVTLTVRDTSSDLVALTVEWRRASDPQDAWQPASVGGLPSSVGTDEYGETFSFFWRSESDGLGSADDEFVLRVTADDGTREGNLPTGIGRLVSAPFRLDNNAPPIVQLQNDAVVSNPDERRGIPIPFRVIDEEGDEVEVLFQWRREGEEFPSLDSDGDGEIERSELEGILADPLLRRERHVCSEYPHHAQGRIVPIDEHTVRLPELAASESWLLASGLVGKTLELLRPSSIPEPITPTWRSNPLVSPAAALPIGDGLTALVLDVPGPGRLCEIELATGSIVREIASFGQGIPTAMALEPRGQAVLVALDDSGGWRIERVELESGTIRALAASDGSEPAPVRGIVGLGTSAAVLTAGSSLFHLDYRDPFAPRLARLLAGLAAPWGVTVDPLLPHRLYVAEHDANRVLAVELDSQGRSPIVVSTKDMQPGTLEAPEALALEQDGARLLVVTRAPVGGRQLEGLELGASGGNVSSLVTALGSPEVGCLATGPEGLRMLTQPIRGELMVAGGIEQRRVIETHSTATQNAAVDASFEPLPTPGQPWRIREDRFRASPQGRTARFVWDGRDAPGSVFLRALAFDDEAGIPAEAAAAKRVRLMDDPLSIGGAGTTDRPESIALGDLDGDGDQDLVSANADGDSLTVFFQSSGGFSGFPLVLGGPGVTDGPMSVAVADLDGDGDQDIVSANSRGNNLTVFFQQAPGSFASPPLALADAFATNMVRAVATGDLDGDGDQDLVLASRTGSLAVFFQQSPGSFASPPLAIGAGVFTPPHVSDSVAVADLDGDGDLDIVSADELGPLVVFFQQSPGSFDLNPTLVGSLRSSVVAAADFDGDGDQDLVMGLVGTNHVVVYLQKAPGNFGPLPFRFVDPAARNVNAVAIADVDGDGDKDLVSSHDEGLTIFFIHSLGASEFEASVFSLSGASEPHSVAAADVDGDGSIDLVSANQTDLTVFLQASPDRFADMPLVLGGPGVTDSPRFVAVADLDGDGDLDLVSEDQASGLALFFQVSPAAFLSLPLVIEAPFLNAVAVADLDGDGDMDFVSGGNILSVLLMQSPGVYVNGLSLGFGVSQSISSVELADLDGDGDQDILAGHADGLRVFFQTAPGEFETSPSTFGSASLDVVAADLDGDGDQDVVSANGRGNKLEIFFQEAPGRFATSALQLGGPGVTDSPHSVAAADLDGDGDLDLVSANGGGNTLTVFFQRSPGAFETTPFTLGGPGVTDAPVSVAVADLDGDGDQDLVSANYVGDDLTVFFQISPGDFADSPVRLGGPGVTAPASIEAADIDGDGDQDLVSGNALPLSRLTIFLGGR